METVKPTTQRKLFRLPEAIRRGRYLFTHSMACVQVAVNGRALGQPGFSLLGKYVWPSGQRYTPNGNRERARRRRQIDRGIILGGRTYVDSVDYGDGIFEHREYINFWD